MAIKYHKNEKVIEVGFEEVAIILNKSKTTMERMLRAGLNQQMMGKKPRTWSATEAVGWYIENEVKNNTKEKADLADLKLKETREEKLKLEVRQMEGELISIGEADSSMAQLAALLVSQYRQLLITLPPLTKRKNETEIAEILDELFEQNIKDLHSLAVEEDQLFREGQDDET